MYFQNCIKLMCLDIKNKISVIDKFNSPVITLNINEDENEEKLQSI